jgi:AcrR family transcriptional regulator
MVGARLYATSVMERATGERRDFRPWRLRGGGHLDGRRRELFGLAAPVFRRHGFRGATIKALAHACGLRPASLYHYFGSKEELATYLLRRPRLDWDSTWVDPETDSLLQLAQFLDLALAELPDYLLALRLADEIAGTSAEPGANAATFREGEAVFARLVAAAATGMSRETAIGVARDALSAMIGSAVLGLDPEPAAAVRERVVAVLRTALVPAHVEAPRFAAAMRAPEQMA